MTVKTFFEKFELLADAPDAVEKVRELIMWSAFSGAFSPEDRVQEMPTEWALEDAPILPPIPASWTWRRGNDVFDVIRGVSYKKNDASDAPRPGYLPLLRANNIGKAINFDDLVYVPKENVRDEQMIQLGDIVIAMSSGSKKLVGKAAPITTNFAGAFGAFCGVIRNKSDMPTDVLARYFQAPQYTAWVTAAGRGIGINNLGRGDLDSLPVPVPPLAEQKRIVAKVDELMGMCDRLKAKQKEREAKHAVLARAALTRFAEAPTPDNLQYLFHDSFPIDAADLRKSILTMAVQGKLVEQRQSDGTVVVNNVVAGRFTVPTSWRWIRFADVGEQRLGKMLDANGNRGELKPYLRNTNLQWMRFELDDLKHMRLGEDELDEFRLRAGDLLICEGGEPGRCAIWRDESTEMYFQKAIHRIRPREEVLADYLTINLRIDTKNGVLDRLFTGATIKHLTGRSLREYSIPLPPLAEQRRIVAKVESLMGLVDRLEAQLAESRQLATRLLVAAVAELTKQG